MPSLRWVCLNMHLIYIHHLPDPPTPQPLPSVYFFGAISQRWKSDTFDNCGRCGVNAAVIAPPRHLCRPVSPAYQHASLQLAPYTRRQARWSKDGLCWELENNDNVLLFCFLTHYICLFYNIKLLRLPFFTAITRKYPSERSDNDSCEE